MFKLKAMAASAALLAATGLAFAQETAPAPQAPAAQQNEAGCPAPGSVPDADLPANCKVTSTTEQPKTDSGTAANVPAQDGTTAAPAPGDTTASTTPADQPAAGAGAQPLNSGTGLLASQLMGQTVYSAANENVGEINDLVIAKDAQGTIMAVIGVGGFLGIGEKDVAVPMTDIQVSKDANNNTLLVINLSREQLESSPAFDRTAAVGG